MTQEAQPALDEVTDVEYYIANYPYQSQEQGDLTFNAGEVITVIKKDGEWWTGKVGSTVGIFPSNYVQKVDVVRFFFCMTYLLLESNSEVLDFRTVNVFICLMFCVFVKSSGAITNIASATATALNAAVESANSQVDNEVSQINENKPVEKPLDASITANAQVCLQDF